MKKILFILAIASTLGFSKNANELLIQGINDDNLSKVKKAIENGADVNQTIEAEDGECEESNWDTPLSLAIGKSIKIVKYLVKAGADINTGRRFCENLDGDENEIITTPLDAAIMDSEYEAANYLLSKGAKINDANILLNIITRDFDDEQTVSLLEKILPKEKVNVNAIDESDKKTVLDYAIKAKKTNSAKLLKENGAKRVKKVTEGKCRNDTQKIKIQFDDGSKTEISTYCGMAG